MGDPRKDPTSETTSKDGEKRGRREEYPSFPMQKPFVKAFTMPRTGITYLYNISMSVNMNMKGTPLKSGVSPINLSNSDDIYLSNRMIDTLTQKPTKGTTCNGCGRTTHLGVPVPYHIRYLLNNHPDGNRQLTVPWKDSEKGKAWAARDKTFLPHAVTLSGEPFSMPP